MTTLDLTYAGDESLGMLANLSANSGPSLLCGTGGQGE